MIYIVLFYPELRLVGPFKSHDHAAKWGQAWDEDQGGNPCWNTIEMKPNNDDSHTLKIEHPFN